MSSTNCVNNRLNSLNINGAYNFPTSDGLNKYVLQTDGSGTVSWQSAIPSGSVIQTVVSTTNTVHTITAKIPFDNTIPQNTEGTQLLTVSITPQSASSNLLITWYVSGMAASGSNISLAVPFFQNSNPDAIFTAMFHGTQTASGEGSGQFVVAAGTTSSTTIAMRIGVDDGTFYVNGDGTGTRVFGGTLKATLTVQEIKA